MNAALSNTRVMFIHTNMLTFIVSLLLICPWFDFHHRADGNLALKYSKDENLSLVQFLSLGRWKPCIKLF